MGLLAGLAIVGGLFLAVEMLPIVIMLAVVKAKDRRTEK